MRQTTASLKGSNPQKTGNAARHGKEVILCRDARVEDIPSLLPMAERFIGEAWSRVGVPYHEETCRSLIENLITAETGILLVDGDRTAMIGAIVHPWHFNRDILTATEMFWWADPGSKAGLALKHECEERARALGAMTINMACQHHMRGEALGRLYRMSGYDPSEHIFIKVLH